MTLSKGIELAMMILASPVVALLVPLLWRTLQARGLARSVAFGKLAIQFATEQRAKELKEGHKLNQTEMLELAVDFMLRHTNMGEEKAEDLIHALLPESSEGAAAALELKSASIPFGGAR